MSAPKGPEGWSDATRELAGSEATRESSADQSDADDPGAQDTAEAEPTPLLLPTDGLPPLNISADEIASAAEQLASGHGPFAIDAERASGFRYSNRAYLIQVRRAGAGTVLIDPVAGSEHSGDPAETLRPLADVLATDEWILHSADQDLPCLADVGMHPPALYDTELGGRLIGLERVNLAAMVHRLLGLGLAKGHGAADWSKRPLPTAWLNYAALDVEVLLDLRTAVAEVMAEQGKTDWATQEFEYLRTAEPPTPRPDRWRRTSGIHKARDPRALAAVRELWTMRDDIARRRDIAPGRVLPDAAIISAANADPKSVAELTALPVFGGPRQRRGADAWLAALARAREDPTPPRTAEPFNSPPPVARWHRRKPEAAHRLQAVRDALGELSERVGVPTENVVSPDSVRRLCWDWQDRLDAAGAVDAFLRERSARPWQRELVVPVIAKALSS